MTRDFIGDLYIVMIYAEIAILWALSVYFFKYIIKKKGYKQIAGNFALAISIFYISYSGYKFFSLLYNYYFSVEVFRIAGRATILTGVILAIIVINHVFFQNTFKSDVNRKIYVYLLLVCTLVFTGLYYVFSNLEYLIILLIFFALLISILIYSSARWFFKVGGFIKINMLKFLLGAVIFFVGASLTRITLYIPDLFPYLFITNGLEVAGVGIMSWGVIRLPSLIEFDWRLKIRKLYILHSSGLVIFERTFKDSSDLSPILAEGGITGIVGAIKEMTKSVERLSIIRQGERNILLEYGTYVNIVLVVEEDLEIYRYKMQELLFKFEQFFNDILPTWKGGETTIFLPARILIDQVFA